MIAETEFQIGGRVQASAGFVVLFMILYIFFVLCTYAVMSHFMMLRKMKQHSRDIISSVMQGNAQGTVNPTLLYSFRVI